MLVTTERGLVPLTFVERIDRGSVYLRDGTSVSRLKHVHYDILSICPAQPDTFILYVWPDDTTRTEVISWAHVLVDDVTTVEPVTCDGVLDGLDRLQWNSCILLPSGQATRPGEWDAASEQEAISRIRAMNEQNKSSDQSGRPAAAKREGNAA